MTITVWGVGTGRTLRAHWALAELGLEYRTRPIGPRTGQTQSAAFRALSVKEKVPVLVHGDTVLTESGAIVTWLGEQHGALMPAAGSAARMRYYEWLCFILTELDAHTLYVMRKHRDLRHLYGAAPAAVATAKAGFEKQIRWALPRVESSPHLLGEQFTGVDILLTTCLDWAAAYGIAPHDALNAYRQRQHERPAYRRAAARNAAPAG